MNNFCLPVTDVQFALSAKTPELLSESDHMIVAIYHQVMTRVEFIPFGIDVTLETICGPEFWDDLGEGEQRYAGKCMKRLVIDGMVPFCIAETEHEYPLAYHRI